MQIKKAEIAKIFEKLTQKDLRDLIDCPMSLEDYTAVLKTKGYIADKMGHERYNSNPIS